MEEIIKYLACCKHQLKMNEQHLHSDNVDILIKLAKLLEHENIIGKVNKILMLPTMETGCSEYRLMNDCEPDDPCFWVEFCDNGKAFRLTERDVIIKTK